MPKPVTIGNEIWFSSIDNNAKTSFTMSEQLMQEAAEKLDRSGINYYAFSVGEAARICVNSADTDKLLSVLGEKTAGLLKPQSLQKPYSPPEKNIIGNAEYRYIPKKTYHSTDTDIALRIAYELEKQNIQYSGNVYNSRKTTLTVSKPDHEKLLEIEKQILFARNTTFNELIEKRSVSHEEVHHSESEQQLQSSSSERENNEISRLKGSGQIRSNETEIHARGAAGAAERSARIGETVSLSEPVRERGAVADQTAGRKNDADGQGIPNSGKIGKSSENDRSEKQLPSGSGGNDKKRNDIQLNIVGNTPYRDIKDRIYYNNIATEELYNKYIKSTIDDLGIPYSGQTKDDMVTFTVSAENAAKFEKFMGVARNLYLIESSLTKKGFSYDQISDLRDHTAYASTLDFVSIVEYLDAKYSKEQLSELAEQAIEMKKITNIFSDEYADALDKLNSLAKKFDLRIVFEEKGFNEDQQEHLLAAVDKGFDVSSINVIDNSFSVDDIDRFTDFLISQNYSAATEFVRNREDHQSGGAKTRFRNNIEAIKTLKTVEDENRLASPEEQQILVKYVGWGGLSQAFDEHNDKWNSEYKELKTLLTPEEYNAAKRSTNTAFYTSPDVIEEMYTALKSMGFDGGKILEPAMGTGNFFGKMPEDMQRNSRLSGIELDKLSGRIAAQLYQDADIQIKGFEKTNFKDNSFDVAVGNVPFGDIQIADKRYDKHNFKIHDYFFAKALDKVRPGGVVAFITSKGTLDKQNDSVRRYIAERADLIGAVRLPNNAFKSLAGTEVTSDILFLQKRDRILDIEPDWIKLGKTADGLSINKYFENHPEMILGKIVEGNKLYGNKDTMCIPIEGQNLKNELHQALGKLQGRIEQIIGVEKATFDAMIKILKEANAGKLRKWRGGRKKKLTMENQLLMTLKYLRQYVTPKELAFEFEVGEATV